MMTPDTFIVWLEGYLDGKESDPGKLFDKIREKLQSLKLDTNLNSTSTPNQTDINPIHHWETSSTLDQPKSTPLLKKQLLTEDSE